AQLGTGSPLNAQCGQRVTNTLSGLDFLPTQFGLLMKLAAQGYCVINTLPPKAVFGHNTPVM
ncbi:hypothetical protein C9I90_18690, partial [Photobacterium aphoticum]